ncbi:MAG: ParB/RepB/Spo0J family partition protein [Eubacterium sp.]|nr:ParB/RepB/Spo0J family partition protein [Eubacterium sp.]
MAKNVTGADIFGGMFQNIPSYESDKNKKADISGKNISSDKCNASDVVMVERSCLHSFHTFYGHPFRVTEDFAMEELAASIRDYGIMEPILVRREKGKMGEYEIISGHRRNHAAGLAGLTEVPVHIEDLSDREAAEIMVDSNNKRDFIRASEKAWAYRTKAEAARQQGKRTDLQTDTEEDMEDEAEGGMKSVGDKNGDSVRTVRRYIRLTYLVNELLDLVDEEKLPLGTGYIISFFNSSEQECILDYYHSYHLLPDVSQAKKMLECHKTEGLDSVAVERIMVKEKVTKPVKKYITIKQERLRKYFSQEATPEYMENIIMELLEKWAGKSMDAQNVDTDKKEE